jgi:multidrug efflux pump subunit AcrB
MPTADVTINLISLFAFIVVLGIVVDDAIVVGENIYSEFQAGKSGLDAAVDGAVRVSTPVVFAVLTSVAAFTPLLTVEGNTGKVMRVIPVIVIATLVFSLIESLLVLPNHLSHLSHEKREVGWLRGRWRRVRETVSDALDWMIEHWYRPSLRFALTWRYVTVAAAFALLLSVAGLVAGGWVRFTFFPPVEADNVVALLTMPQGTPAAQTAAALRRIETAAMELEGEIEAEHGEKIFRHVLTSLGSQPYTAQGGGAHGGNSTGSGGHLGEVNVELLPSEERSTTSAEVADLWRQRVGAVAGAEELTFTSSLFSAGSPVYVQFSGADPQRLEKIAARLKAVLGEYPGVQDVADTYRSGKEEIELDVTPEAQAAGLTLADVARQTRQAFYGEEAQRIQRGRDEVKVMVRFPESERRDLGDLESLRFRAPGGVEIPFSTAVRASLSRGPASIQRVDRQRVLAVTADVDPAKANANEILADLRANVLPGLLADYPGVRYTFEGEQQEQRDTLGGLARGFAFALLAIYVLLAIPFRSYAQPLIVMSAIPFGFIGAVLGHLLMGIHLTVLSMFGIVALTGVVVNDSLVMVDFINQRYREGTPLRQAIRQSGVSRFRAITLTSLTTFAGLAPLLLERSVQAQFLIPMAVSLAFGVLFATFITLLLVPVGYYILEDVKAVGRRLFGLQARDTEEGEDEELQRRPAVVG